MTEALGSSRENAKIGHVHVGGRMWIRAAAMIANGISHQRTAGNPSAKGTSR